MDPCARFVEHLPLPLRDEAVSLGERVAMLVHAAREAWPAASPEDFVAYIAERMPVDVPLATSLDTLRVEEVLLAWACARGDPSALRKFRDEHYQRLRVAAARAGAIGMEDDVAQSVMTKLLARGAERPPAIEKYAGRGSLAAWLDVTAMREARNALHKEGVARRMPYADEMDSLLDGTVDVSHDPELESLKRTYRVLFKQAFQRAFAELDARARTLLRHEHLDGLDGTEIAALYGVNKATVSRWRAQAREVLLRATRRIAEQEMNLAPIEFESVMRLIQSQLHVSLTRVLREHE